MSTSISPDGREARLDRRIADLYDSDPQFAAARPDPAVGAAVDQPALRLHDIVRTVMEAYADRPALGRRAVEYVTDAAGRTAAELLPRFDTLTYQETWDRVRAVATALTDGIVRPGDRVAILGFTSVDYTIIDMALNYVGAVAVPLQTSASIASLRPILVETEPVALFSGVDFLDDAVELVQAGFTPRRLVVFDHDARVDADREAVTAAASALSSAGVVVELLTDLIARGRTLPAAAPHIPADPDPLMLLVYTSGSTGTPKGAMYPERLVANSWRASARQAWGQQNVTPSITLSFMPMSHMMGRGILYAALAAGGTAYFAARSDLSTFLEDVALVRPTQMNFVPRIWEMLFQEAQTRIVRDGTDLAELRGHLVGDRGVSALTGSAPISPELKTWVEDFLDLPLTEGYGSTEAGAVFVDGQVRRPPVRDYKLLDVPDLGYFHTDRPFPRGELLVKSDDLIPGYYKRPEITAEVFDEDGYYRTGDIVAETGPDQLRYLDRRNNVLKLSQGEFVTVSTLEAVFGASPLMRQIYLYGNSARSYLLAVVVPTEAALERSAGDDDALRAGLSEALQTTAREAELQSYEIPRDFLVETEPFTLENGLLTGIRKLARPKLKEHYGPQLEQLYVTLADDQSAELRAVREGAEHRPVLETVGRAAAALLGAAGTDVRPDAHFTDLGGDSLSALTFGNLLTDVFAVDVPVGVIVSPANDLAAIAAYIEAQRSSAGKRPTYDSVHGREAAVVHARDLTLDRFIDTETLDAATALPAPTGEVRTVLLTGATGFLGRYLALDWLERMSLVDGKVVCLVRAKDDAAARQRLDDTFDSGDPKLLEHYRRLSGFLEVLAGDKGEADLGLPQPAWRRLAETVDLIVDPAALVNHVLPYRELFGPNALGTAELIRLALTAKIKPFTYVSTIGVGAGVDAGRFTEDGDVREISPSRIVDDNPTTGYANGYGNSKWAGEVLLRAAHELCGLPVAVFRCDMILADTTYAGQLNLPDMFTRMILSLVATGIAPESFYELDEAGRLQRAHYDGLPVEFIAEAIDTLGAQAVSESGAGFATYHVMNQHDDGIGLDQFVDWLVDAGYRIDRIAGYDAWLARFETAVRAMPERPRQYSLLPLLHNYRRPERPLNGAMASTERFRAAVQEAKLGPDKDIPHVTPSVIVKYATDLELLGLL